MKTTRHACGIEPRLRLYLSSPAMEGVFGSGKWVLLNAVKEEGSLQKAAKKLGRGYRKAWGDIKIAEKGLGFSLVEKTRGGSGGGKTVITRAGLELLAAWDRYRRAISKAMEAAFRSQVSPILKKSSSDCKGGRKIN